MTEALTLHVLLPVPLRLPYFEYLTPDDGTRPKVASETGWTGCRVRVPFGRQTLIGVVIATSHKAVTPQNKLKRCISLLDTEAVIPQALLALNQWASGYYQHPPGETLFTFLPTYLREGHTPPLATRRTWRHTTEGLGLPGDALKRSPKQQLIHQFLLTNNLIAEQDLQQHSLTKTALQALVKKGLIHEESIPAPRFADNNTGQILQERALELSEEQQVAINQLRYHQFGVYLLEGVTGSGKTEIYLQTIAHVLQSGRQALVLVPEIGLTPQTLQRFEKRFAVPIVALHSNVAKKRKAQDWLAATRGEAAIVIGTRSAAATPMPQLGIIIIDEEHDLSFKQQDGLRYSARDLSVLIAKTQNVPLLMGSATPSLESLHNALQGRYTHLHLKQRASGSPPQLTTVDMRGASQQKVTQTEAGLGQEAIEAINETLKNKAQVLVFINRRGYAPSLVCQHCGWVAACRACDAKLTLHQQPYQLRCHHCDTRHRVPPSCPSCRATALAPIGVGTERCEAFLKSLFPSTNVMRVDADSMSRKKSMQALHDTLQNQQPCILVGTQMLAKGHHFPGLELVVMLDVDASLFSGDFRGTERMGQLVTQVAGRAGRGDRPGKVLLQTYRPDHPLLQMLITQGYSILAKHLLKEREQIQLPPYRYMALVRAESKRADNAVQFTEQVLDLAKTLLSPSPNIVYIGPIPSLIEKRQDRWRFQGQIHCLKRSDRHQLLKSLMSKIDELALSKRVLWSVDVDPLDFS